MMIRASSICWIGKVPFAAYGKANGEGDFPYVDVDGKRGIQLAIEHLIAKGHERIGLISWPQGLRIGDMRTRAISKPCSGRSADPR